MHVAFRSSWPAAAVSVLVAACGGGGGGGGGFVLPPVATAPAPAPAPSPAPPPAAAPTPASTLKGTTTLHGAEVTAFCSSGPTASSTAGDDGRWSLPVEASALPCVLRAVADTNAMAKAASLAKQSAATPSTTIHSLVRRADRDAAINPLTDLVMSMAIGQPTAAWLDAHAGSLAQAVADLAAPISEASERLKALLDDAGYALEAEPAAAFDADAASQLEGFFASLTQSLQNAGMTQEEFAELLGAADVAPAALPYTRRWTNAQAAAMPQLNHASLGIANGVLSLNTGSGLAATAGAFVGGGTGNKAVLQLPGFDGLKVRDFKSIEIELQPDPDYAPGQGLPYVSFDFVIDMQCGQPPLGADATIAQARSRYRTVTYDTYYQYLQPGGEHYGTIVPGQYATAVISPESRGWRASAGVPIGSTDLNGSETGQTPLDVAALPADACFADAAPADAGMFRNAGASPACAMAAALDPSAAANCGAAYRGAYLFLGSSGNSSASTWQVHSLRYNGGVRAFSFE